MKKMIILLVVVTLALTSLISCTQKQTEENNVPLEDIVTNIKNKIKDDLKEDGVPEESFQDDKIPMYIEEDLLAESQNPMIQAFNKDSLEAGVLLQPMMNVKSDLIIIAKVASEEQVSDVMASLEKVKENQDNTWKQYLPDQYEKVKNNVITSNGKYVIYATYDDAEAIKTIFMDSFAE